MDTTQTIILTLIVNTVFTALVGGIVVYTLQKKIDATIQKSLFEHETKFRRNYKKWVEVLETLYQKFMLFRDAQKEARVDVFGFVRGPTELDLELHLEQYSELDPEKYFEMESDAQRKLDDFWHYFEANRLYLPSTLYDEIRNIHDTADILNSLTTLIFLSVYKKEPIPAHVPNELERMMYLKPGSLEMQPPEFLLGMASHIMDLLRGTLEYIYQSVSMAEH